jgi:hypothetical protein
VHLFPLLETVYEAHAHMPIVHWIRRSDHRSKFMTLFAELGFKRTYFEEKHFRGWTNLEEFTAIYSEVLETMTNYKTSKQMLRLARAAGLQADYSYTKDFLVTKMLTLMGRTREGYVSPNWIDGVTFPLLKRFASVTMVLRAKDQKGALLQAAQVFE